MLERAIQVSERYAIKRQIGAGGCGIVYEALDRTRKTKVALKTLARLDAAALYRFKKEFRALADVTHPNLVQLYELEAGDPTRPEEPGGHDWYFTMELVEGVDFLTWVRRSVTIVHGDVHLTSDAGSFDSQETIAGDGLPSDPKISSLRPRPLQNNVDHMRLREALIQLAEGVEGLHAANMLHRDIKPSNVLVTASGRVVLLDFGIVADLRADPRHATDANNVVGTPAYMAPEQGAGQDLTTASDWYSVGVVLYEALTGRLPFVGSALQILTDKQRIEPPAPRELAQDVPQDLDLLCRELLRVRPESRPSGREVLRRLGRVSSTRGSSGAFPVSLTSTGQHTATPIFVGREEALASLNAAYDASRQHASSIALVQGKSGMGKSSLVRRFLDEVIQRDQAVVLAGRCYERESVPYKAFDAVIDALSRHLLQLEKSEVQAVLPRDAWILTRVFPVLGRVAAIAESPRRAIPDPRQLRGRAFGALRELLARIADRKPTIVAIDDLQWGDADSVSLLSELASPPDAPPMLFVLGYRSEELETSPTLRDLLPALKRNDIEGSVRTISIDALSADDARRLASKLLSEQGAFDARMVETIAAESAGNPLFIGELVRYVQSDAARLSASGLRLERALRDRFFDLPDSSRTLLEVIAVAGWPIRVDSALQASGLDPQEGAQALSILRVGHLVRTAIVRTHRTVEPFHDRLREAVLAELDAETKKKHHAAIARALHAAGETDPEALLVHFENAGLAERAIEYAQAAAEKAARALAFDRSAQFHRTALALLGNDATKSQPIRVLLADALAYAGRGPEAAAAYLGALEGADSAGQLELRRRAAEQLLVSGHIDRGMEVVVDVLKQVDMRLAPTPLRALIALVFLRLWLKLRGFRYERRDESQVSARELSRIDICRSIAFGLGAVDNIRGAPFQTRHLMLCLEAGEPSRLARALNVETCFVALGGSSTIKRADALVEVMRGLVGSIDRPEVLSPLILATTGAHYFTGRFRLARPHADRAIEMIREKCSGMHWELGNIEFFNLCAMTYLGEIETLSTRLPNLLREADDRGDLYLGTNLRVGDTNVWWLTRNEPSEARRIASEAMARWSHRSFHVQHSYEAVSLCQIDLYEGNGKAAFERADATWPKLKKAMQSRIQLSRVKLFFARGRGALATGGPEMIAAAKRDAARLHAEKASWCRGLGLLLEAGASALAGSDRVVATLERAVDALDAADLAMHAMAARRRLGEKVGGDRGRDLVQQSTAWMEKQGIRDPSRMTRALAPGFQD